MIVLSNNASQTLAAGQSMIFNTTVLKCGSTECHRANTSSVKLTRNGIYKVEFSDLATINKDDMGYIALAKALNIIGGDEIGNVNPNKNVTRAEAVTMAIKLINCGIDR